jgi:hypothetical protein
MGWRHIRNQGRGDDSGGECDGPTSKSEEAGKLVDVGLAEDAVGFGRGWTQGARGRDRSNGLGVGRFGHVDGTLSFGYGNIALECFADGRHWGGGGTLAHLVEHFKAKRPGVGAEAMRALLGGSEWDDLRSRADVDSRSGGWKSTTWDEVDEGIKLRRVEGFTC